MTLFHLSGLSVDVPGRRLLDDITLDLPGGRLRVTTQSTTSTQSGETAR